MNDAVLVICVLFGLFMLMVVGIAVAAGGRTRPGTRKPSGAAIDPESVATLYDAASTTSDRAAGGAGHGDAGGGAAGGGDAGGGGGGGGYC